MLELANRRDRRSEERGAQVIQPLSSSLPPRSRSLAVSSSSPVSDRTLTLVRSADEPVARHDGEDDRPSEAAPAAAPPSRWRIRGRTGWAAGCGAAAILVAVSLGLIDGREPATATVPPVATLAPPPIETAPEPPKPATPETVKEVQQLLAKLGYHPGPIDGIAGPQTRMAIASFLRTRNIDAPTAVNEEMLVKLRGELVSVTGL